VASFTNGFFPAGNAEQAWFDAATAVLRIGSHAVNGRRFAFGSSPNISVIT
jgi:hypothetical protein